MMEYVRIGVSVAAAVALGPKVEAKIIELVKPEDDFALKAIKYGTPVGVGIGTYAVSKMLLGAGK